MTRLEEYLTNALRGASSGTCVCVALLGLLLFAGPSSAQKDPNGGSASVQSPVCGAACLLALHVLVGDTDPGIDEIARECKLDQNRGINFLEVKKYLERHDFDASAKLIKPADVRGDHYYFIPVRIDGSETYNHYFLLVRRNGQRLTYFR